jgi:hypothetical protein
MKDDLKDLIREARRKLRKASGVPLTSEEEAEERHLAEIEEMKMFLFKTMSNLWFPLKVITVWTDTTVAGQFTVDGQIFELRKDGPCYRLFRIARGSGFELARLDSSDPNFASRVLVAIDDALLVSGKPGTG